VSVIPDTQEAEIRRIVVQGQSGQKVKDNLSEKQIKQKRDCGGVA
jgi:translation initiation factor 1 (eIF-1/SUI1)